MRAPHLFLAPVVPLLLGLCFFASASDQPSATFKIAGNTPPARQNATFTGHKISNDVLEIVVGLKMRDEHALDSLIARQQDSASPDYHHWITPDDFVRRFAPTQSDVNNVIAYLASQGLSVLQVTPNHMLIQARGMVSQIERAFSVTINNYQKGVEEYYSNDRDPSVPGSLKDVVQSVTGMDSTQHFDSRPMIHDTPTVGSNIIYTPPEIATIYNFPSRLNTFHGKVIYDGTGMTIAIATAFTYLGSDIDYFWTYFSPIQRTGTVTNICVNGCTSQLDYEPTLDVEYAGAQAPGANLIVYEVPSASFSNFELMYSQMASDNSAQLVSISWGTCEANQGKSVMKTMDTSFAQMVAEGMTIFAGSGDYGAYGYLPGGCGGSKKLQVGFPPSDPNVTAVGGTSLTATTKFKYASESAWTDSGGGTSSYFARPSWQVGAGVPTNKKRDIPDIAFDADGNTGQYTYYQGVWYSGFGTSSGGPNMAGYWALVLQALKGTRTGNVAPLFYQLGASTSYKTDMHDVTTGNNGAGIGPGFSATANWDYTTGWGSINGTKALSYFLKHP